MQNIQYFDSVELARKEYFNDFASSNKVSKHFISLITQLIKEKKNKSLASILVNTKESNLQMFVPVIDSLKKFYLNNDIPYSIERSEGLYQFGSFLTMKEMNLKDTPENRFKMAIKYFTGRNLDATMFWIVRKALNANDPSAQNFLKEFYAHCKNPEIVEKLKLEETKYIFASDMSTTDGLILLDNTKTTWANSLRIIKER